MRVIWITYDVFDYLKPSVNGKPSSGRHWVQSLFENLVKEDCVSLATITPIEGGSNQVFDFGTHTHFTVPKSKSEPTHYMSKSLTADIISIINDFKPDIIHIHGTEINFGLLRKQIDKKIPIVCSVQGIIPPCASFLKQSIANSNYKRYKSLKNIIGVGGIDSALRRWNKYTPVELEIFRINQYFIGRTLWDKAYVSIYNPEALYFHGEELLRKRFYSTHWDINSCDRHRIFISSSAYALKGFHVLIKAAGILKRKYPNIKLVSPLASMKVNRSRITDLLISEDYSNYLKHEVKINGLENNIELKENLTETEMSQEYAKAHIFVLPSFLENSPNSLGEAMLIGTPSVVSPVGGVSSVISNEISALTFPADDHVMMAYQIDRIFSDDQLAYLLSNNAKEIARKRHNIRDTINQYIGIYNEIINVHKGTN